jgi:hypothetical protein
MEFTADHKKHIEDEIVKIMINASQTQQLSDEDLSVISTVVLDTIDQVSDQVTLQTFLQDLVSRWPVFKPLLILELKEMKEKVEDEVAEGVLLLARHGKIENAIKLAKSATNK